MTEKKIRPERKPFFRFVKCLLRPLVRKIKIVNENEGNVLEEGSIFLCNHVGSKGPLALEFNFPVNFRFCGTHEMNEGLKSTWRYLKDIYFSQKNHHSKFGSWCLATLVAPLSNGFYKGLRLISTYTDNRLRLTFNNCFETLEKKQSIIIFPEDSSKGYFDQPTEYFAGFYILAKQFYEKYGRDIKIYNMYFRKEGRVLVIGKAIPISKLLNENISGKAIAEQFRLSANGLAGSVDLSKIKNTRRRYKS